MQLVKLVNNKLEMKLDSFSLELGDDQEDYNIRREKYHGRKRTGVPCFPKSVGRHKNGLILKKRLWSIAAIVVICCVTIGIVFSREKNNHHSPTKDVVTVLVVNCNGLCLNEIIADECPKDDDDLSKLEPCDVSEINSLCIIPGDNSCPITKGTQKCQSEFYIYRKKRCPIDEPWITSHYGHEYYVETELFNWESHRLRAVQSKASLASFHSQDEMNFIMSMVLEANLDQAYIGGIRRGIILDPYNNGSADYWKWIDDTPWNFTAWETGQPNGGHSIFNTAHKTVAVIRNFQMYDELSTLNLPAVYKRPITDHSTVSITHLAQTLGGFHTCAFQKSHLYCWGYNYYYQLGFKTRVNHTQETLPTNVPFDASENSHIKQLALGYHHSCVLLYDGTLNCWGSNSAGQVGISTIIKKSLSTPIVVNSQSYVTQIATGRSHSCAVLHDKYLKCWGFNYKGQLGDGTTFESSDPVTVNVGTNRHVTQIALGDSHTCALLDDGSLMCWGLNDSGQLGDGTRIDRFHPTRVDVASVTQVAVGGFHTCAILDDHTLKCWGHNHNGQVGDGTSNQQGTSTPTTINVGSGRYVTKVALGGSHTCAILDDGSLKCWGDNKYGQLGDGTNQGKSKPGDTVDVGIDRKVIQIALGKYHSCAVLDNESLICWGWNYYGQLGDGTDANVNKPSSEKEIVF